MATFFYFSVMAFVQKAIARLNEPEKLEVLLKDLGRKHVSYGAKQKYVGVRNIFLFNTISHSWNGGKFHRKHFGFNFRFIPFMLRTKKETFAVLYYNGEEEGEENKKSFWVYGNNRDRWYSENMLTPFSTLFNLQSFFKSCCKTLIPACWVCRTGFNRPFLKPNQRQY